MALFSIKHIEHTNPLERCLSGLAYYQYYVFVLISACKAPVFWHVINLIFLAPHMHYTCNDKYSSDAQDKCPCENLKWNKSVFTETMQTKFGLYCDYKWITPFANSLAFCGALVGCPFFGFCSDKFGRLNILSGCLFIIGIAGSLIAFMPSIVPFIIMRILEGFGAGGAVVTSYVLIIEFCSSEYRDIVSALFHIPLNIGHMSLPLISYLLRNMDHFQLAISIPMFFLACIRFFIIESPKWLMDNHHIDELEKGLKKICPQSADTMKSDFADYYQAQAAVIDKKMQFWHIFKYKKLTMYFGCMAVNFCVCGMGYYGVSHFIGGMSGNIHLNVFAAGLAVTPGTFISVFFLKLLSRRTFLMATNSAAGILMISVVFIPKANNWLRVVCACFACCSFLMSFIVVFLYAVELFPTQVRNSVLGVLSFMSRFGQTLVPPINALSQQIAGTIFGLMAILGALLCLPLPDTKNVELPSNLGDVQNVIEHHEQPQPNSSKLNVHKK